VKYFEKVKQQGFHTTHVHQLFICLYGKSLHPRPICTNLFALTLRSLVEDPRNALVLQLVQLGEEGTTFKG
jgi:hypothetical protein